MVTTTDRCHPRHLPTQTIIFLYLLDNDTSWMVLLSNGVGLLIEYWKVTKALNITFAGGIPRANPVNNEISRKTKEYDEIATNHLMYVVAPLVTGYALYSLNAHKHKGWYSWIISSLVGFIYAFGFVMMTPQLFINYKLKSVAHLPWKAMIYKSLNTFIDDLFGEFSSLGVLVGARHRHRPPRPPPPTLPCHPRPPHRPDHHPLPPPALFLSLILKPPPQPAFVIQMPLMHRLACLRDDLIFLLPGAATANSGRSSGKAMTSLMVAESVSSMISRSMPMPMPPVGGMPCSRAVRKSSSTPHASSSPAAFLAACASKRSLWSIGSVSSEKALASSRPTQKSSKRSVTPGLERCGLASGEISTG